MRISYGPWLTWMGIRPQCLNKETTRDKQDAVEMQLSRKQTRNTGFGWDEEVVARETFFSRDLSHRPAMFLQQIHLKYSIPFQSLAQTISCPELLTVSLAGGLQSYSTWGDFTLRRLRGEQTWLSWRSKEGNKGHHLQNKQSTEVTTNSHKDRAWVENSYGGKKKKRKKWCELLGVLPQVQTTECNLIREVHFNNTTVFLKLIRHQNTGHFHGQFNMRRIFTTQEGYKDGNHFILRYDDDKANSITKPLKFKKS